MRPITKGYTLIEILVVIFIIGTITTFILLKPSSSQSSRQLKSAAKQLTAIIHLAQEQAILQQITMGLNVYNNRYEFLQLNEAEAPFTNGQWSAFHTQDTLWQSRTINPTIEINIQSSRNTLQNTSDMQNNMPMIIFCPTGEITPFTLTLRHKNSNIQYQISGTEAGEITSSLLDKP